MLLRFRVRLSCIAVGAALSVAALAAQRETFPVSMYLVTA
jgi:hypothetical protein